MGVITLRSPSPWTYAFLLLGLIWGVWFLAPHTQINSVSNAESTIKQWTGSWSAPNEMVSENQLSSSSSTSELSEMDLEAEEPLSSADGNMPPPDESLVESEPERIDDVVTTDSKDSAKAFSAADLNDLIKEISDDDMVMAEPAGDEKKTLKEVVAEEEEEDYGEDEEEKVKVKTQKGKVEEDEEEETDGVDKRGWKQSRSFRDRRHFHGERR